MLNFHVINNMGYHNMTAIAAASQLTTIVFNDGYVGMYTHGKSDR